MLTENVIGATQASHYVASSGAIVPIATPSPSPTPSPTPNSNNLANQISTWQILFGATVDYSVTFNGQPTMRFNPGSCEVDANWYATKPGDHIVFKCMIKSASGSGRGGIIGFDVYGNHPGVNNPGGRLWEVSNCASGNDNDSFNSPKTWSYQYVPSGSDWTQMTIDVTIPSTVFSKTDYGESITPSQISGFIPWLGPMDSVSANIWFAQPELYVNP